MTKLGRHFSLSPISGAGVSCGATGLFVDDVPLLEVNQDQSERWQPRPVSHLNRDLGERYGLPIDCNAKIGGLAAIARALNRGDILHAQIVALHLQFPDPLALTKAALNASEIVDLARQLRASGLLKADWDPFKHPRWPAGRHRRRIRAAGRCRRRFGDRGSECTGHPRTIHSSSPTRLGGPTRSAVSLAVRNRACATCAAEQQSHYYPTESLSGPTKMRKGMGDSNARLLGPVVGRPVGTGLYPRNGHHN